MSVLSTKAQIRERLEGMAAVAAEAKLLAQLQTALNRIARLEAEAESLRQTVQRMHTLADSLTSAVEYWQTKACGGQVWDL